MQLTAVVQVVVVVVVGSAAHSEPNYKAGGYSSVDDVYKGKHKSYVPLGLSTGVLQLSFTLFTLRELVQIIVS